MGKVITPQAWITRPTRRPVSRDGWEPVAGQVIEPTFQRTGWSPPGTISLVDAAAYLDTTVEELIPFLIRRAIPVVTEIDGTFFLDRSFIDRMKANIEQQYAMAESR